MLLSRNTRIILTVAAFTVLVVTDFQSPSTITGRQLMVAITNPSIQRDGSLLVGRRSDIRACDYFVPRSDHHHPRKISPVPITSIRFHFEDCAEHQLGNRLGEHYQRYLLASVTGLPYQMTCGNVSDTSTQQIVNLNRKDVMGESVLKHLEGDYGVPSHAVDPRSGKLLSIREVCNHCGGAGWDSKHGPEALYRIFKRDMWKLAYNTSIGESTESEDAVIHLRLGDALKGANDQRIGILPHKAYTSILEHAIAEKGEIKTIGIVTQPFERELARGFDRMKITLLKSEAIAVDLKRVLTEAFPSATVRIHNDKNEIPLKSFARLIKAKKVSICGSSTFCTYPVLSVRDGLGYVYKTERHSPWAPKLEGVLPNIRTYVVPRLANNFTAKLDIPQILHWLRHQDLKGDKIIDRDPLLRNSVGNLTADEVKLRVIEQNATALTAVE